MSHFTALSEINEYEEEYRELAAFMRTPTMNVNGIPCYCQIPAEFLL